MRDSLSSPPPVRSVSSIATVRRPRPENNIFVFIYHTFLYIYTHITILLATSRIARTSDRAPVRRPALRLPARSSLISVSGIIATTETVVVRRVGYRPRSPSFPDRKSYNTYGYRRDRLASLTRETRCSQHQARTPSSARAQPDRPPHTLASTAAAADQPFPAQCLTGCPGVVDVDRPRRRRPSVSLPATRRPSTP